MLQEYIIFIYGVFLFIFFIFSMTFIIEKLLGHPNKKAFKEAEGLSFYIILLIIGAMTLIIFSS